MQSLYTNVPVPVAVVGVQLVHTSPSSTHPASAHVKMIDFGSTTGDVQLPYTSMRASTPADVADGAGVAGVDVAELGAGVDEPAGAVIAPAGEAE